MSSTKHKIFISYSHKDEDLKNELKAQLNSLRDSIVWSDRDISAGDNWKEQIDDNLRDADLILLLISANFISSKYCFEKEMTYALQRDEDKNDNAAVVPIIIRDCVWDNLPFSGLQALPRDGKAVTDRDFWSTRDKAFKVVVEGIRKKIKENTKNKNTQKFRNWNNLPPIDNDITIVESYKYDCDRIAQRNKFQEHFWQNDSESFFFAFICGDREQQIDSFFERIRIEILPEIFSNEIRIVPILDKPNMSFKFGSSRDNSILRFRKILEKEFHHEGDEKLSKDFDAIELIQIKALAPYKVLVLHFKLFSRDWLSENHGHSFINWLIDNFFKGCIECVSDIKIVVVLSISFNHSGSLVSSAKRRKNRIKKEVTQSIQNCKVFSEQYSAQSIFCDIGELASVEMEEVREWVKRFYKNNQVVDEVVEKLFGAEDRPLKMAEIERKIHGWIDYLLNKENPINR